MHSKKEIYVQFNQMINAITQCATGQKWKMHEDIVKNEIETKLTFAATFLKANLIMFV